MPFDGPSGYEVICEGWAKAWTPRLPPSTSAWAGKYRRLSGKSAAEPGPWRNERIPFLASIMDALDQSHPAPIVCFVGSSQIAKSECGLNWIGKTIHKDPAPMLALFPNEKQGRKWVRVRLDTMLAETPELRVLVPPGRRSDAGNSLTEKHYPGGVLFTGSANIPSDLASVSVRYLLLEELDRMPVILDDEGDPVDLAMARIAAFARSKVFMNSTPTTEETSRIWKWWLASTMDRYHIPCPHCDHMQHLRWEQLKWTKPSNAAYVCEEHGCVIEEHSKTDMLQAGQWRSTHPEQEEHVKGFHANGLMTPIGLGRTWANHAAAWERAQGSQARVQVFFNTRMGEIHKGERQKVEWAEIKSRAEPYPLRTIPKGVLLLTSGTDVQADRLETQILGFGRGDRITVIDVVAHYGDTTRLQPSGDGKPSVWAELDEYLAAAIVNSCGVPMRLSCSLIDSGYLTDVVLGFTRTRKARGIFALRGSATATREPIGRPAFPDTKRRGKVDQRGVERYEVGVSKLKHWLFECLRADAGKPDEPVLPTDRHIRFSTALPDEYFRQLTAETYDPKHGWVAHANYHRNEGLDTFIYARAAAMHHSVAVHRYREADWVRLEQMYEPAVGAPKVIEPILPVEVDGAFLPTRAAVGAFR